MKITKYVHSCLLIEHDGKNVLIDPGEYSYDEHALNISGITKLDYLLITHEHADHMSMSFLKDVVAKFPTIQILSNASVKEILAKENIHTVDVIEGIDMMQIPHGKVFGIEVPLNVQFDIFGLISNPGDSHQFTMSKEVLCLPVQAPWGSLTRAVEKALEVKPKVIIPIHDWHWNEKAREGFYTRLKGYFAQQGIDFKALKTGEEVTI